MLGKKIEDVTIPGRYCGQGLKATAVNQSLKLREQPLN